MAINENLEDVTAEQLQVEARCIVQHQGLRKLMKADSFCICFVTKHHCTVLPRFLFTLFYILLFSIHIVNVNMAKKGTVSDNLNVNIYIFKFRS